MVTWLLTYCAFFMFAALLTSALCDVKGLGGFCLQLGLLRELLPGSYVVDSTVRNGWHLKKGKALKLQIQVAFFGFLTFS